jgi:hypothetical protein
MVAKLSPVHLRLMPRDIVDIMCQADRERSLIRPGWTSRTGCDLLFVEARMKMTSVMFIDSGEPRGGCGIAVFSGFVEPQGLRSRDLDHWFEITPWHLFKLQHKRKLHSQAMLPLGGTSEP